MKNGRLVGKWECEYWNGTEWNRTYDSNDGGIELEIGEATELSGFSDNEFGIGESEFLRYR